MNKACSNSELTNMHLESTTGNHSKMRLSTTPENTKIRHLLESKTTQGETVVSRHSWRLTEWPTHISQSLCATQPPKDPAAQGAPSMGHKTDAPRVDDWAFLIHGWMSLLVKRCLFYFTIHLCFLVMWSLSTDINHTILFINKLKVIKLCSIEGLFKINWYEFLIWSYRIILGT